LRGFLQVPRAVNPLIVHADLRARQVGCSIRIDTPQGRKAQTKITWLLRQLANAGHGVRVETHIAGSPGEKTVSLLGTLRKKPGRLLPSDGRDIQAFTLNLAVPMGLKGAAGKGSFIGTVVTVTDTFYADVAQHLKPAGI
jgi:hypothetical protein